MSQITEGYSEPITSDQKKKVPVSAKHYICGEWVPGGNVGKEYSSIWNYIIPITKTAKVSKPKSSIKGWAHKNKTTNKLTFINTKLNGWTRKEMRESQAVDETTVRILITEI